MTTCPHNDRRPCNRCQRILTLLEHLEDYEPALGSNIAGNGGVMQMPPMYHHPSIRELRRTLGRLYDTDHTAHAHLIAYYRAPKRQTKTRIRTRIRGKIRWEEGPYKMERVLNGWISASAKERGELFVMREYRGEPFLPDELLEEIRTA